MLRNDDPGFKKLTDGVIAHLQTSGEAANLYQKWFTTHSAEAHQPERAVVGGDETAVREAERSRARLMGMRRAAS